MRWQIGTHVDSKEGVDLNLGAELGRELVGGDSDLVSLLDGLHESA